MWVQGGAGAGCREWPACPWHLCGSPRRRACAPRPRSAVPRQSQVARTCASHPYRRSRTRLGRGCGRVRLVAWVVGCSCWLPIGPPPPKKHAAMVAGKYPYQRQCAAGQWRIWSSRSPSSTGGGCSEVAQGCIRSTTGLGLRDARRGTGWPERSGIRTLFQHTVQHTMGSLTGRLACTECPSLRGLNGTPEWIRTTDLLLRRQTLYPSELRAHNGSTSIVVTFRPEGQTAISRLGFR